MKQSIIILIVLVINTCHAGSHDPHTLAVLQTKAVTTKLSEGTACISSTCNAAADNLQNLIPKAVTSPYSKEQREELICKIISESELPYGHEIKLSESERKKLQECLKISQKRLTTELFAPLPIDETHSDCKTRLVINYKDNPSFCKDHCESCCVTTGLASLCVGVANSAAIACVPLNNCIFSTLFTIGLSGIIGGFACGFVAGCCCHHKADGQPMCSRGCDGKPCCDPDLYMLRYLSNPTNWDMTEETSDEKVALLSKREAIEN